MRVKISSYHPQLGLIGVMNRMHQVTKNVNQLAASLKAEHFQVLQDMNISLDGNHSQDD
jgi:hypothetical protein